MAGRFVTHRLYRQPSPASNRVSCAPGCGRSRRAKTRIAAGQPRQLVPGRAFAEQPGQLGDVRFLDPARPVRAGSVCAGVIGAALADLAAAIDRGLPGLLRDQPQRGLLPLAQRPARPSRSAHSRGGRPAYPGGRSGRRILHAAARLVRGGRRRRLKIQATWPWAQAITAAWQRIDALPQAP